MKIIDLEKLSRSVLQREVYRLWRVFPSDSWASCSFSYSLAVIRRWQRFYVRRSRRRLTWCPVRTTSCLGLSSSTTVCPATTSIRTLPDSMTRWQLSVWRRRSGTLLPYPTARVSTVMCRHHYYNRRHHVRFTVTGVVAYSNARIALPVYDQ